MDVLVVGGTGPTGPLVVEGLLRRGHRTCILHTGKHEVDLGRDVEHIHADPHFADSLSAALERRHFDLAIAMYGRLAVVAPTLRSHARYLVGIGGMFYRGWVDNVLHRDAGGISAADVEYVGAEVPTPEHLELTAETGDTFSAKALAGEAAVGAWNNDDPRAVLLRFPRVYGPRQPAPVEWCVVRRIQDGRSAMLVPDGGLLLITRAYSKNAAAYVLAAAEKITTIAGRTFNVGDPSVLTLRDWVRACAAGMGVSLSLVSLPLELAGITFPYAKGPFTMGHKVLSLESSPQLLDGGEPLVDPHEALAATCRWYAEHPIDEDDAAILGDSFDYATEDQLIELAARFRSDASAAASVPYRYRHNYRHPTRLAGSAAAGGEQ
jgi:nucleoside-diphosphate-sugar epimerase